MAAVARILSQKAYNVPGKIRITEYFFEVPRDWSNPTGSQKLRLFARGATRRASPADPSSEDKSSHLPWVVYLTGGPGFGCPSPQNNAWTNMLLDRGYQVLCLDQRGTGLSSAITASTLGLRGNEAVQAQFLKSFRADSIVKDFEAVRVLLTEGLAPEKRKWSLICQSYGGFCAITYLSFVPLGLREVFMFGGLQPLVSGPDEVYRATYRKLIERNVKYYEKFPEDIARVQRIVTFLQRFGNTTVRDTSDTGFMTARRFMQIGIFFGMHGGFDTVHDIVIRSDNDLDLFGHLTRPTVAKIESHLPFNEALIYAILHESIYCQGQASNWAAMRIWQENAETFQIPTQEGGDKPVYFTGEMVYPWMFDDYSELRKVKEQAELVAQFDDWPQLFDVEQLQRNEVPVYAAAYMEDMYVDFKLSMQTAKTIKGCKPYISNMMYHDALRSKMDEVFKALFALRDDTID